MNEQIRKHFTQLNASGQRFEIISYLQYLIKNQILTDFEDMGFCYWNISDNYALLRDAQSLCSNHKKFYEHIKNENDFYLYWLVCDATQKLTLEKDGYAGFWWDLYKKAVEQNFHNNCNFVEFNAHRAALYKSAFLPFSNDNIPLVRANFENFLNKTKETPEYPFYKIIYSSLISRFSSVDKQEIRNLCEDLFIGLSVPKTTKKFLIGEWQSFVTPFDIHKQSVIGINSAINAFVYDGDIKTAKEIYVRACDMGLPKNRYIETRLKEI